MSLQFILGPSGSGKSTCLYQWVIDESMKHPDRKYLVIVPEQFTMSTQRSLVTMHPRHGILNIDVLSFKRLALRIFEDTGTDPGEVLTETGKNLLIRRAASLCRRELETMGSRLDKPGYISKIKSLLSEFEQYEISGEDLAGMIEDSGSHPSLQSKLRDVETLMKSVEELKRSRYITAEEILKVMAQVCPESEYLNRTTLAFDGFTGFTPVEMTALEALMKRAEEIRIALTIDPEENLTGRVREYELFAMTKKTVQDFVRMAGRCGVTVQKSLVLTREHSRFRPGSGLSELERTLFRYGRKPDTQNTDFRDIRMCGYETPEAELEHAAALIRSLVMSGKYRYRDIAVIAGSLPDYAIGAREIFARWDIPLFIDQTVDIVMNPCLEFIRGALEIAMQDFSYESVFRFLRTGLSTIGSDRIDILDNYCQALGIRGRKRWNEEWTLRPFSMTEEMVLQSEETRKVLTGLLGDFPEYFSRGKYEAAFLADQLEGLCERFDLEEQLAARAQSLRDSGDRARAMEYEQIYGIVTDLLGEIRTLLGGEKISGREFSEILEAGFSDAKIGIIPPGIDQVHMGDMERTRLEHIRVLIFTGMNDGWVPSVPERGGIVSENERDFLEKCGYVLSPNGRQDSYRQKYYLYLSLTKPSSGLYLSWCSSSPDGKAMRPSYIVRQLSRDFKIREEFKAGEMDVLAGGCVPTPQVLLRSAASMIRQDCANHRAEKKTLEVLRQLSQDEEILPEVVRLVKAGDLRRTPGKIAPGTAEELYGRDSESSVTRLETFAGCPYEHFALYGLRLRERQIFKIRSLDTGTLCHEALRIFEESLQKKGYTWNEVPEDVCRSLIDEASEECIRRYGGGLFTDSARNRSTADRLKRTLERTVWACTRQVKAGRFVPTAFEKHFGRESHLNSSRILLPGGGTMDLTGSIDRIDLCRQGKQIYVKVIDYKSGQTDLSVPEFYFGLQLQLQVYLNAALEMEERENPGCEVIPAGILYQHLGNPMISAGTEKSGAELDDEILKTLRPKGLLCRDEEIVRALDSSLEGGVSRVVPVKITKDGLSPSGGKLSDRREFRAVSHFTGRKQQELGASIMQGHIEISPAVTGTDRSQCSFCLCRELCGFDRKLGDHARDLTVFDDRELWNHIIREDGETDGN